MNPISLNPIVYIAPATSTADLDAEYGAEAGWPLLIMESVSFPKEGRKVTDEVSGKKRGDKLMDSSNSSTRVSR